MNTKNFVVCSAILACVSFASVRVSTQEVSPGFPMGWKEGIATVVKDGVATTLNFRLPIEAKVVKGAPFSADIVTENIQTLADGNRIVQRSNTRVYRDGEGRVRREEDRGAKSPVISITDPVSGQSYLLDPESRVARQTPSMAGLRITTALQHVRELTDLAQAKATAAADLAKAAGALALERSKEQIAVEQLPGRAIEGVLAEGVRRTTTIAAGAIGNELPIEIVSEEWTSPDLKILVMTERRDPRLGTSTYRLVNIIRAEPDRYLFEVPSDYTLAPMGIIRKPGPAPRK